MKVIIAGGRDITPTTTTINDHVEASTFDVTELVCGNARGVDRSAKIWANARNIPVVHFDANWNVDGRASGPLRNKRMAAYGDALILIWDGESRGSASMKREAEARGLPIYEVAVEAA